MYKVFRVRCSVRNRIVANFPENPEALKYIVLRAKKENGLTDAEAAELQSELAAMQEETLQNVEEATTVRLVFLRDEEGIYITPRNVKGWLKEIFKTMGVRGYREAINHGVFVEPYKIYFTREGEKIKKADGELVTTVRGMTIRGPRVSVKIAEYIEKPCEFEFKIRAYEAIAKKLFKNLKVIEALGGDIGFLGDRSLQEGQCDVEIVPE